jgi:phospholipid-binding lipoprotein MlaA
LDDIALDKYTFVRDSYLQRRRSLVFDGDPPETPVPPVAPLNSNSNTDLPP